MIVAVDTNMLIDLATNADLKDFRNFIKQNNATLALCTPIKAEFLVKDDNQERSDFLTKNHYFNRNL